MIYALIGHRGTGKTQLLNRLTSYYERVGQKIKTIDLDQEIVTRTGKDISQIFSEQGEQAFRQIEMETATAVLQSVKDHDQTVFLALGAGFKGTLPLYVKVIWVSRPSDKNGRVFLDRPRLEPGTSPMDEYIHRFDTRESVYGSLFHKEFDLGEGIIEPNVIEPILLGLAPFDLKAGMTILPHLFQNEIRLEDFLSDKLLLGITFFEMRDDLLTHSQIERLTKEIPHSRLLYSFRTKDHASVRTEWLDEIRFDWDITLGDCPYGKPYIASLHKRTDEAIEELGETLTAFPAENFKLAIPVESWTDLWAGHRWFLEDTEKRSFLPMSKDGRWAWYRQLFGDQMKANFVRHNRGSAPDQPRLFDWIKTQKEKGPHAMKSFAAVLGDPVTHSRTPVEHSDFFTRMNWPVVAIKMKIEEANQLNFSILERMGLKAAAVTAPLKEKFLSLVDTVTEEGRKYNSVNTLAKPAPSIGWVATNTDIAGFKALLHSAELPNETAVWGGGGTRKVLSEMLPQAQFFSARTWELATDATWTEDVRPKKADQFDPKCVVWAVGRKRMSEGCQFPPEAWKPLMVIDLNYSDDSPGREYAVRVGAQYISGLQMFKAQAEEQRGFWSRTFKL